MKKKWIFVVLIVFIFSCSNNSVKIDRPLGNEIDVKWQNLESIYQGEQQFLSEFEFTNNSKFDLQAENWAFYFNSIRKIKNDSLSLVRFNHVNGDLYRLVPTAKFRLAAGESIKIPFVSELWVMSKTDAPAGGFFVFNDSIAENCNKIQVGNFEHGKHTTRKVSDIMPVQTAEIRYEKLKEYGVSKLAKSELLPFIPSPNKYKYNNKTFVLDKSSPIIFHESFRKEAEFLKKKLKEDLGISLNFQSKEQDLTKAIHIEKVDIRFGNSESYKLLINDKEIKIIAFTNKGVFNAIQSLRGLIPAKAYTEKIDKIEIKGIEIEDFPRFEYRGMHLDIARNFQSKESLLKLLDAMAFYKLNKLHLHFCDDEGWRIEINGLPELTEIGSKRAFSTDEKQALLPSFGSGAFAGENSGSGFYSRADFIEILKFAAERHIEIIPEIDVPGHARAAIVSMNNRYDRLLKEGKKEEAEKYLLRDLNDKSEYKSVQGWNDNVVCVTQESVYTFLELIVNEFSEMYKEAGAEFKTVHTGGDEVPHGVWEKSPVCAKFLANNSEYKEAKELKKYFISRFSEILDKYDLKTAGWEEIVLEKGENGFQPIKEFSDKGFIPYVWNNVWNWGMEDIAYQLANSGFPVVLSNVTNLYFDLAYEKHPEEPGYYWGGFTDTRKPFEFTPLDVRNCSYEDFLGNKIEPYKMFEGKELLQKDKIKNIIGIQGQLWSENTKSAEIMDYMIFPKILALAERAWAKQTEWSKISNSKERLNQLNIHWNIFANTLGQRELTRLDYLFGGVNYRISPPAASINNGMLEAFSEFPGMEIRFTTDGSKPSLNSELYTKPIEIKGEIVKIRSFSSNGRGSRICELAI